MTGTIAVLPTPRRPTVAPVTPERGATERSLARHVAAGLVISAVLVLGIGGWATFATLSGAVIAPGVLVVEGHVKQVQHLEGGIIGALLVREGDAVAAGDVLVRLDDTLTRANLAIVANRLVELRARQARLVAERDDAREIAFPADLLARLAEPGVATAVEGERTLFAARRDAMASRTGQLEERRRQLADQISGYEAQVNAKQAGIALIDQELDGLQKLYEEGYATITRVLALRRDATELDGQVGQLTAQIAEARGQIVETGLQIDQVRQDTRQQAAEELRAIEANLAELEERRVAAEDQLARVEIRSPQTGIVHQLAVHTTGGVIRPGETIMAIVPTDETLLVESRIGPADVDAVEVGQSATIRLSGLSMRTTPELQAVVAFVSADLGHDPQTGLPFYVVRLGIPDAEVARLDGRTLVPGMPVEAFIQTAEQTVLRYLLKPLEDQVARAFREE